jgi:hypothetical protein
MPDLDELLERIDRLSGQAESAWADLRVVDEINDVLCEGFARALAEEARLDQLEQRVSDLLSEVAVGRAAELRTLTLEWRRTERSVDSLRSRLAIVHERFIALAAGASRT